MWLAPLALTTNSSLTTSSSLKTKSSTTSTSIKSSTSYQSNIIFVMFDEPLKISYIKLWNYSKTPSRGVKEIEVILIIFLIF